MKKLFIIPFLLACVTLYAQNEAYTNVDNNFTTTQTIIGGVNPLKTPSGANQNDFLTEASFPSGLSFHNISSATGYPTGVGHVWTFHHGASRTHRFHFDKNSAEISINAWDANASQWVGWRELLSEENYKNKITTFSNALTMQGSVTLSDNKFIKLQGTTSNMALRYDVTDGSATYVTRFQSQGGDTFYQRFDPASTKKSIGWVNAANNADFFRMYDDGSIHSTGGATFGGNSSVIGELTVSEKVESKRVRVSVTPGSVPDYVFAPDYELMSLEDIATYIRSHKHLPNIPAAQEMEQNGQDVGRLQLRLLEKIEELTLHTIRQEETISQQSNELKKLRQLEDRNQKLEKQLEHLLSRIEALEAQGN